MKLLEPYATAIGLGEIFYGPTLALDNMVGGLEPVRMADGGHHRDAERGCDLLGRTAMIGDHGGFAHDDTNVQMAVAKSELYGADRLGASGHQADRPRRSLRR